MRGHEPLIALRCRGRKPDLVSIYTDPNPWQDWKTWPEWTDVPQIEIPATDAIGRLDLRWAVDLNVMLAGFDADRVQAIYDALKAAGASRVIAVVQRINEQDYVDTVSVIDSMETANG